MSNKPESGIKTAVKMAYAIGDQPAKLSTGLELNPINRLFMILEESSEKLGKETWLKIRMVLAQAMLGVANLATEFKENLVEQLTAENLRLKFGKPESTLALPVFSLLAKMDTDAARQATASARELLRFCDQIKDRVADLFQTALMLEINNLEMAEKAEQAAEKQAVDNLQTTLQEPLAETRQYVTGRFGKRLTSLRRQIRQHQQSLQLFRQNLGNVAPNQVVIYSARSTDFSPVALS